MREREGSPATRTSSALCWTAPPSMAGWGCSSPMKWLRGAKGFPGSLSGSRGKAPGLLPPLCPGAGLWSGPVFACVLGRGRVSHACRIMRVGWVVSQQRPSAELVIS